MKKIFLLTTFIMTFFVATAFAAEEANSENAAGEKFEFYKYTSETYGYQIDCPLKPVAVVVDQINDGDSRSERLIFSNDGAHINYGFIITLDAFDSKAVPDFNKADKKVIDDYLEKLKTANQYSQTSLVKITDNNKGVFAVLPDELEVLDENGEVEGTLTANNKSVITFFRTPSGRCISIQLLCNELSDNNIKIYRYASSTFKDADKSTGGKNKSEKKSDKKNKKDGKSKK